MKCSKSREYRLIEPLTSQMITSGRGLYLISLHVNSSNSAPYLRFRRTIRRMSGYEPRRAGLLRRVRRCPRFQRISAINFLASCTSSHVNDSKSFFLNTSIALYAVPCGVDESSSSSSFKYSSARRLRSLSRISARRSLRSAGALRCSAKRFSSDGGRRICLSSRLAVPHVPVIQVHLVEQGFLFMLGQQTALERIAKIFLVRYVNIIQRLSQVQQLTRPHIDTYLPQNSPELD